MVKFFNTVLKLMFMFDPSFHLSRFNVALLVFEEMSKGELIQGRCDAVFYSTDMKLKASGTVTHAELSYIDNKSFMLVYQCAT